MGSEYHGGAWQGESRSMKRVMLLDDDEELRISVRRLLEKSGYEVTDFGSAEKALVHCRVCPPDLMLTDMVMPETPGYEVIVRLRRDHPDTKIVAMSGGARLGPKEYLDLARLVGADLAIAKPFRGRALVKAIRNLLGD